MTVLAIASSCGFTAAQFARWSAERGMAIIETAEEKLQEARTFQH